MHIYILTTRHWHCGNPVSTGSDPKGYGEISLRWRQNGCDGFANHQPHDCLLNCLFRRRSKKASKLRVSGLCAGNSPVTGEFPAQRASNAENVSTWWRHHVSTPSRNQTQPCTYIVGCTLSNSHLITVMLHECHGIPNHRQLIWIQINFMSHRWLWWALRSDALNLS